MEKQSGAGTRQEGAFLALNPRIDVLTGAILTDNAGMARGIPSEIQVGARTYTCRQIADGAGLSLSLVSLIFRAKRPVSPAVQTRLATFFRLSVEQLFAPGTITVHTPRLLRPVGRVIGRRSGKPAVVKTSAPSHTSEPCSRTLGRLEDILPACLWPGRGGNRL